MFAGESLVPESGLKSALNPESALYSLQFTVPSYAYQLAISAQPLCIVLDFSTSRLYNKYYVYVPGI